MKSNSGTKAKYLRTLEEYVEERLYITDRTDEFQKEFDRNCWHINGSKEEVQSLNLDEWKSYLRHLIHDRQEQLNKSSVKTDLVIYFWHDEQAGQLRFNVITANHSKLPFACKYVEVPIEDVVVPFINDKSPGFIPFDELKVVEKPSKVSLLAEFEDKTEKNHVTKVYVELIKKELRKG